LVEGPATGAPAGDWPVVREVVVSGWLSIVLHSCKSASLSASDWESPIEQKRPDAMALASALDGFRTECTSPCLELAPARSTGEWNCELDS
jgi:hypothetical protein